MALVSKATGKISNRMEVCHTVEQKRDKSQIGMSHVTLVNESYHTYKCVISPICMSVVTHTNGSACVMSRTRQGADV